jgi:hypothetical protein
MATIGSVTKREDGRYEGELKTLSVRACHPAGRRQGLGQPARLPRPVAGDRDRCRLDANRPALPQGVRVAVDLRSRLGSKTLYANLGRAAGQTDPDVYALIWNPQD